jgi:hypothetical protein
MYTTSKLARHCRLSPGAKYLAMPDRASPTVYDFLTDICHVCLCRYVFHYIVEDRITYLCMSDDQNKRRVPFAFLEDVKTRWVPVLHLGVTRISPLT